MIETFKNKKFWRFHVNTLDAKLPTLFKTFSCEDIIAVGKQKWDLVSLTLYDSIGRDGFIFLAKLLRLKKKTDGS